MDSRGQPMYLHPGISLMGELQADSVPKSIPDNVPIGIPVPEDTGMPKASLTGNHITFSHKTEPNEMPVQQHYTQQPLTKEIDDEGRLSSAMLPESSSPVPSEGSDVGPTEGSQKKVKTEQEEENDNFIEVAHDLFQKISSKEITITAATKKLGRKYSYVYARYQEFCGNAPQLDENGKRIKKGRKKRRIRLTIPKPKPKVTGEIYQCKQCPAVFYREAQLKTHLKVHIEDNESHKCTACGVVFSKLNKLMNHRVESHQEALQCPHCDSQFTNVPSYNYHIVTHTGGKPYRCDECGKGFTQKTNLQIHQRTHTGERPFMCGVCGKTFMTLNGVKAHRYTHTGKQPKPYECDQCGKRYQFQSALKEHKNTHTDEKPFVCGFCDARFNFKQNLMRHQMVHTGEQPFQCDLCPQTFYLPTDLKRHKISHTGLKPYKCDLCDYACTRQSNLVFHKYVHTGETPYKCDFYGCNAKFSRPKNLKKHKLQHGPLPPKICKVCNEKFPELIDLKRHMMIHTGQKPYTCDQCFKTCIDESSLKRHMYKHMYRPLAQKTKQYRQSKKNLNPTVKKIPTTEPAHTKWPTEYQGTVSANTGQSAQGLAAPTATVSHHAWNINADYTNFVNKADYTNLVNNAAWPSGMDPDEFRRRLLHSFK